jgi:hypothetical protein
LILAVVNVILQAPGSDRVEQWSAKYFEEDMLGKRERIDTR